MAASVSTFCRATGAHSTTSRPFPHPSRASYAIPTLILPLTPKPRSSSNMLNKHLEHAEGAHDGKKALVIRRASLTTVFEGKEHAKREKYRSDEEENEDERRHGLLLCASGSSNGRDPDRDAEPTGSFMLRFRNRKSSPHIPFREVDTNCASPFSKAETGGEDSPEAECQDSVENEGMLFDGQNIPSTGNIDAPIREMETMVLSSHRRSRSRSIHTLRSRAKSLGILRSRSRQSIRFDTNRNSDAGKKSDDGVMLGLSTESKVTVLMRFACGQLEGQKR